MKAWPLRTRVTAWYLAVLTAALLTLAGGGWWLLARSIANTANRTLIAQVDGVREFIGRIARLDDPAEIADEFREYAELTMGDSLIEVIDASGRPLLQPTMPWWPDLRLPQTSTVSTGRPEIRERVAGGRPFRVATTTVTSSGGRYLVTVAISMRSADAAFERFGLLLAGLTPVVLILAAVGGYWISGRALAPLEKMTAATGAITLRSLNRRLDVPAADDELRRLAVTFNEMLARLEVAVADVVRFTAEASHELRTPVSVIRTTGEVALDRERTPDEYRRVLAEIVRESERMSTLVDDLLILARADAGVDQLDVTVVDLRDVATSAVQSVQPAVERKAQAITVTAPAAIVPVRGHARSLGRLVFALLDNAVKYTPPGGAIDLDIATRAGESGAPGSAILRVRDTGQGVDPVDAPHVFDRFYRGRDARGRALEGSGLGLSMALTIARRMGGDITLARESDARGAVFEVTLRLEA